ncbi:hypothetical protein MGYG_04032 [Nannizzia gypsea CBS 118893]|uniref:Uncharacterized protein n=1 Tax=Arthroderma gypseum (strain ATCC MYA-4604 / CBS 118893) TaxID=535722 RepID=E4UUR2_ARTGP|nr:hypothetical protein MGYG_04032 [Nannizzia gypsea CBS 118893]EFR01029.1 hypothetical protein MGYG_04032 [Nannizzia gypsea CBS 118893]
MAITVKDLNTGQETKDRRKETKEVTYAVGHESQEAGGKYHDYTWYQIGPRMASTGAYSQVNGR